MEHILPRKDKKISPQARFLCGLAGGALVALGVKQRSFLGGSIALVGADLLTQGVTGHHLHETLGIVNGRAAWGGARRIPHQLGVQVQRSILVNASPEKTYEFVRNFENFPRFMEHLKNVYATSEKRSHWVAKGPARTSVEWDAEIINDLPGEVLAWRSIDGADVDSAGSINFQKAPDDRGTIIRVELQYLPPAGALGAVVAKILGEEPELQLKSDLRRLKQVIETGEIATTEGQPVGGFAGKQRRIARRWPERQHQPIGSPEPAGLLQDQRASATAS
jgi:uncharacterized membrane protein